MTQNNSNYGQWALITGAAKGLGAEFARQSADQGYDLILVDKDESTLAELESEIHKQHSACEILTVDIDLAEECFLDKLLATIGERQVGLLINNAGISYIGEFLSQSHEQLKIQLAVNTRAVLVLTRYFAQSMAEKGKGGIIILSSGAAELPSALNAHYAATKAYDLKLAESLWLELGPKGVDVLGFMPAATKTHGIDEQGVRKDLKLMSVEFAVSEAFYALGKYPAYIPGMSNRLLHIFAVSLPRKTRLRIVSKQIKKMFEPGLS